MTSTVRRRRARPAPAGTGRRSRPTRRRYLARRWTAALVVLGVLGLGYVVLFTPLLGVRAVEVSGTRDLTPDEVRAVAAIEPGTPMARLDTAEIALRVGGLPMVFEVRVSRSWPGTVEVEIVERDPVAVRRYPDGIHLIDRTGLDYATVETPPPGLPLLRVADAAPDDPATRAAVTVLTAIPGQLAERVVEVSADTPGDVRLTLADKRLVKWGDAEDNERKGAVLAALLTRPGKVFDVVTPEFPTVS